MKDHPYIEFNQGYAMQVWYDKPTDSYTLTQPIGNKPTVINVILQCKTIEFGRTKFIKMMENIERIKHNLTEPI